ncbi:twin-arginine translocase subunit TatC [Streptacidiphilus fuscans]|uniref:Sec-independent protein translocase protein TatC n=1 Tax=Streptacidiphilus fuscans TaxID=2789292 RepID=A0A931FED3_9ACTN|nr:twin-arginine translocase subunit TatC [Streptacidiphilus fuscans]MBF9068526.1 twin-arginine translocase subunit TatC [Streptacidiphilus fuscans]
MSDTQQRQKQQRPPKNDDGRMPLADHLRELRYRLIVSILALLVTTVIGWLMHDWAINQLVSPACHITGVHGYGEKTAACPNGLLVNNGVLSPLTFTFKIAMMIGFILASPVWSYQLWAFVAPGLYKKEKKYGLGFVAAAVPLFLGGAYLAYEIFPKALQILASFNPANFSLAFSGAEFLDFFIRMVLVFGLSFEVPLLLVMLNFLGIVSAARLRGWWRGAVFGIFVFSAIAVPTGDPVTMTVLAVPMCLLYFAAVGVATLRDKAVARRYAENPDHQLDPDQASDIDLRPSSLGADDLPIPEPVNATELAAGEPMTYHPDDVT